MMTTMMIIMLLLLSLLLVVVSSILICPRVRYNNDAMHQQANLSQAAEVARSHFLNAWRDVRKHRETEQIRASTCIAY